MPTCRREKGEFINDFHKTSECKWVPELTKHLFLGCMFILHDCLKPLLINSYPHVD